MMIFKGVLAAVCAYMLGSLSMSICISKCVMNSDVRAHGSGNAGATNMARVFGRKARSSSSSVALGETKVDAIPIFFSVTAIRLNVPP